MKPVRDAAVRSQERRGLCACKTGYANDPGTHNNQVRQNGRCYCECHGTRLR